MLHQNWYYEKEEVAVSTAASRTSFIDAYQFAPSPTSKPRLREMEQKIVEREVRAAYEEIRRRKEVLEKLLKKAEAAKGAEFKEFQRTAQAAESRVHDAERRLTVLITAARDEGYTPPVYRSGSGAETPTGRGAVSRRGR